MADNTQAQIDQFNDELSKIQDRLNQFRQDLGEDVFGSIAKNLNKSIIEARRLSDPLKDAAGIGAKLNKLIDENELLIIEQKVAQDNYTKALQGSNTELIESTKEKYRQITAQLKIKQGIEDQLKTLQQISEEEKRSEEQKKKENNLTEFLLTKYKNLKKELTGLFALGSLVDMLFKGSENIANFRKELGMSYGNAYQLNTELSFVGANVTDAYITGEKLKKSFTDLSKEMGFVADYGTQALVSITNLTGRLGMSNKEAAQLTTLSRFQSKDTEKVLDNVGKTVSSMNKQKGTAILLKDVMKDIGNVSMATAVSLGKNPVAIAEAVVAAKQLGTTLEQMEKTADSLLNFESSIENELKAELLTGKQMNLERARAAALSNDMKTLTEEIGKNQEVINTFAKGNRLEQQAVAESLGMSREDLAKMIYQQEAMKIGAEGVRKKYGEQAYENLKAQNAQEKFTNAVEKLKAALSGIVQIFSPILDALATVGEWVSIIASHWAGMSLIIIAAALVYVPKLMKSFAGMADSMKNMAKDAMKLFNKEGRASLFGGGASTTPTPTTPDTKGGGAGLGKFMDKMPSATSMIKGAAALLIISGAIFVAAKAFQEFAKVNWDDMAKAGVALLGLSAVAIGLSFVAPLIFTGSLAIAALGASLIPLALAVRILAPGLPLLSTFFESLQNVDAMKLLAIGPALAMIGVGLASLGAGGIISAIGAFLGGDPIKKIQALAESGDGLQKAATGLQGVAGALTQVSAALAAIDISKIEALEGFATKMTVGSVVKGITDFITAPIKAVGSMVEGTAGSDKNDAMVKAINEVRDEVKKLYNKNTTINMDGKRVGTTLTQGSTKLA